jgi:putative transcriptional regulator
VERGEFASFLRANPEAGDVVPESGGVRKVRWRRQGTSPVLYSSRSVVPSKTKPLSTKELAKFEAARDLGAELAQSIHEMKAGKVRVAYSPATEAREKTGLSQSHFAALLGVSVPTLQGWEQGRKQPSGAARTLLTIARTNPKALLAVAGK